MSIMFSDKKSFPHELCFSVDQRCKVFVLNTSQLRERIGSVVECLTRDRRFKFGSAGIVYLELRF